MVNYKFITLGVIAAVCLMFGWMFYGNSVFGANVLLDENSRPATDGASCQTNIAAAQPIGDDISSTILAASSSRAYARIQRQLSTEGYGTSTAFLSFDEGAAAVVGHGVAVSTSTPFIEFGLNTDNPYTGAVTGILQGGASSTVLVTVCTF